MHNINYNNNLKLLIQLRLSIRLKDNEKQYRLPRLGKRCFFMKKNNIWRQVPVQLYIYLHSRSKFAPSSNVYLELNESVHRTDARFETILGKTKWLIYLIDVLVFFNVFVIYIFVLKWHFLVQHRQQFHPLLDITSTFTPSLISC